ncbi:MAG: DUF4065 domain-containing protein [Balneolaceae bacterium]|nr:DUF4065 domain-containing protein [Balneolaceae bacterium]
MKSPYTGGEVIRQINNEELEFRGEKFTISYNNYKCVDTGKEFTTRDIDELNMHLLHSAYRKKHNIPFPEEIKNIREKYRVNQTKMAEILGFGPNTFRNYENGDVPQLANAKLISIASKPSLFIDLVNDCDSLTVKQKEKYIKCAKAAYSNNEKLFSWLFRHQEPNEFTGYKAPSIEKLNAMIALMALNSNFFKVKLCKLLFYSDFCHFKQYGQSISGTSYQAIPMGPVPHRYGSLFEFGAEKGAFSIELVKFPEREGERFISSSNSDVLNVLTAEERKTLLMVKESLGSMKTDDLINISHEEAAWLENKDEQNLIDYNYAFILKYPKR